MADLNLSAATPSTESHTVKVSHKGIQCIRWTAETDTVQEDAEARRERLAIHEQMKQKLEGERK